MQFQPGIFLNRAVLDPQPPNGVQGQVTAKGMVRQTNTECLAKDIAAGVPTCVTFGNFELEQTVQGLRDDGKGSDLKAKDYILGPTSSSFSLFVTPKPIPEPGTVMGLLAFAGLGSLVSRKKRSK